VDPDHIASLTAELLLMTSVLTQTVSHLLFHNLTVPLPVFLQNNTKLHSLNRSKTQNHTAYDFKRRFKSTTTSRNQSPWPPKQHLSDSSISPPNSGWKSIPSLSAEPTSSYLSAIVAAASVVDTQESQRKSPEISLATTSYLRPPTPRSHPRSRESASSSTMK